MTVARICALGLLLFGCDAGREQRLKQSVAQLCWAEDRLRAAPNAQKAELLAALSRTPCPEPAACAARDVCTAGYTLHVDALALTQVAKQSLADGQGERAAKLLGAAEEKLKLAAARIDTCTSRVAALRRSYTIER